MMNEEKLKYIIGKKKKSIDCYVKNCKNYHKPIENCVFDNVVISPEGVCAGICLKEIK